VEHIAVGTSGLTTSRIGLTVPLMRPAHRQIAADSRFEAMICATATEVSTRAFSTMLPLCKNCAPSHRGGGKSVLALAVRWVLDQGPTIAFGVLAVVPSSSRQSIRP
jgi:hypothetical protein